MIRLNKILVPTDFSEFSDVATRYGCEFAERFGAELHLLNVIMSPLVEFAGQAGQHYSKSFTEYEEEIRDATEEKLSEAVTDPVSDPNKVIRTVKVGAPFLEIIQYAKTHDIDMIVMGTHGRTGLKHLLMGSVAERVVRQAPCPVLSVRHPEHEFVMP